MTSRGEPGIREPGEPGEARERAHQAILDRLPEYATAAALGTPPEDRYPDVAAHLAGCAACRAELEELLALTVPAYAGEVEAAPTYPRPDLSFLGAPAGRPGAVRAPHQPEQSWLLDAAGRLVIAFSQGLLDRLRQPALAGAARGRLLYRYAREAGAADDLEVTIEVFAEDPARDLGRVRVCVEAAGRDPLDQAGNRVELRAGSLACHGETDETGEVAFPALPLAALPGLRVEIAPRR